MQASFTTYSLTDSTSRIDEILDSPAGAYADSSGIPSRDKLTFTNGFYVAVTVLFIDMCDSKSLNDSHNKPVLAKIYRAFISESIAVLNSNPYINEIYIEGDGVWAIFDTTSTQSIQVVINTSAKIRSLVDILNVKLNKKGYANISAGIGIDYGNSLMIKAGYKSSKINEVVWIGKVIGSAAKLCKTANRNGRKPVLVSEAIYTNLNDEYKNLFSHDWYLNIYEGEFYDVEMDKWIKSNA